MREVVKSYPQVSLSVRKNNPAISLYERLGFTKIEDSEQTNTAGSISFKMINTLVEQAEEASANAKLEEERFRKSYSF